ncbi:MAG: hypothetical protein WD037_05805 [Balneolales bacterium]
MSKKLIDLTGKRFGEWIVVNKGMCNKYGNIYWNVKCDCGTERSVQSHALRSGNSKSCGCSGRKSQADKIKKHGRTKTTEYNIWNGMIRRCTNPKNKDYNRYGGRGIKVCTRWRNSFELFYSDMGDRPSLNHSIDRIDNNGNYELSNCKWSTWEEQNKNKRLPKKIKTNTSGHTGVYQIKSTKKWAAELRVGGKLKYIGCFKNIQEAVQARDQKEALEKEGLA